MKLRYDHFYDGDDSWHDRPETKEQVEELLSQLKGRRIKLSMTAYIETISSSEALNRVFVAIDQDADLIVGMAVVSSFGRAFLRRTATIDEVVVHKDYRRHGIGKDLCKMAIRYAWENDADTILLTSGDRRPEAHALYSALGFMKKDTNVFVLTIPTE